MAKGKHTPPEITGEYDIYSWWQSKIPIEKLQEWINEQVKAGAKTIELKVEWGYYQDIDRLTLIAQK